MLKLADNLNLPLDFATKTAAILAEWNLVAAHGRCNKRRGTKRILQEETREAAEAYIASRVTRLQAAS